jgi:hypothetical protein
MQQRVAQPAKEKIMTACLSSKEKIDRQWFGQAYEFVIERFVLGSLAALIVYAGYRMFLL